MEKIKTMAFRSAMAAICCSASSMAIAQVESQGAQSNEEIVVTADRRNSFGQDYLQAGAFRDARIIDTPLTVSVLSRELLDAQQAGSIMDAARNTAGVTQSQLNSTIYSNLSIRGIAVDNLTNFRFNGILPIINFIDMPIESKDRVEILKGAAGLYYGFASPSGIVNLVSSRATADPVNKVDVSGNLHGSFGGHVDIGRRWGDVGLRVNAAANSLETGVDRTTGRRFFTSAAFDWSVTDRLTLQLDAEYIDKSITEATELVLPAAVNGVVTVPPLQKASKNVGATWLLSEGYEYNLLARLKYTISDDWSVTFGTGESYLKRDRRYSSFSGYNLATGNGTLGLALTHGNDYRARIVRGDVAGVIQTGPIKHNLLIGASYYTRASNIPAATRYTFAQNLYDPIVIPEQPTPARTITSISRVKESAVFIFDRASVGEWLNLIVGYRKTDYEDRSLTTIYKASPDSWSYGALVKPMRWLSIYGNYIEGLESGGIVPQIATNAGQVLPAALSKQREFGVKLEPRRGFLITGAYFDIDRTSAYLNAANLFVQDGQASFKGFEFSGSGNIGPNLSLSVSGVFLDAVQRTGSAAVVGNVIENTSKFSGSIFAEYRIEALDGLRVSAGMFRVGRRAANAANTAFVKGYTTFDLGLRYETEIAGHPTSFRLYGENVGGREYWAATGSSLLQQGVPRTVKVSVATSF